MSDRTVVITMTEENVRALVASYMEDAGCVEEFFELLDSEATIDAFDPEESITVEFNVRIDGESTDHKITTLEA